jgi:hypothetical protein
VRMYSKRRCVTCYVGSFLVMDNVVLLAFWWGVSKMYV